MADDVRIPPRVQALADQANGTPLAWKEHETTIVIVFVDGRKLTFDKVAETVPVPQPFKYIEDAVAEEATPPVSIPNQHKRGKKQ
jgi:hypothetical protein